MAASRIVFFIAVLAFASASGQTRPAVRRDQASVQFMITHAMREELAQLGYSASEISALQPERARAIIDNQIQCPSQGMPSTWKRGGKGKSRGALSTLAGGVVKVAAFGLATGLALHFSGMDLGDFSRVVDDVLRALLDSTGSGGGRRLGSY